MAGGLVGLLDDVAALAKLAAASIDDVGAAAGKASVKAAGVVVDDTAVTPGYVQGLAADREIPIVRRIAMGSLRNKLVFILPAAIALSSVAPKLVEVILMCGGAYLCYEGAHKAIHALKKDDHDHDVPVVVQGPEAEEATINSAIRTDFILSAEIMVIALKDVIDEPVVSRAIILAVVAVLITIAVYGLVALIVKMDDVGLTLARKDSESAQRIGRAMGAGGPGRGATLSTVGIAAMLWVGGHILLAGAAELGWHTPYDLVHDLAHALPHEGAIGGVISWLANTLASALIGIAVGVLLTVVVERLPMAKKAGATAH